MALKINWSSRAKGADIYRKKTMTTEQKQQGIAHEFHTSGNPLEATLAHWVFVVEAH